MAQADADDNGGHGRLTGAEKEELAELRRRNRQLEAENEPFSSWVAVRFDAV